MLKASRFAELIESAVQAENGDTLACYFSFRDDHCRKLFDSTTASRTTVESTFIRLLRQYDPWGSMAAAHFGVIDSLLNMNPDGSADYVSAFEAQKAMAQLYNDMVRSNPAPWTLPVAYTIARELRVLAIQADDLLVSKGQKPGKQEEMIRLIQTAFGACCSDRASTQLQSRKRGVLYMATLLFKTYFKLKSLALCKNVIRGVQNATLHPSLPIPMSHRVTYEYYLGVLAFLKEEYDQAESHLDLAFRCCFASSRRNQELILDFLIPLRLLNGKRPSRALLRQFRRLDDIYRPLSEAICKGDIKQFDQLMRRSERRLLERGTYLIAERCREICLCNLVRILHHSAGGPHQIPLCLLRPVANDDCLSPEDAEDEVECVLANLIDQDHVRGYIAHAARVLVLSKAAPFQPMFAFAS